MIVANRESMASLYHDTSPILRYNLQLSQACIIDSEMPYFSFGHYHQMPGASCGILHILVLSPVPFMQSLFFV